MYNHCAEAGVRTGRTGKVNGLHCMDLAVSDGKQSTERRGGHWLGDGGRRGVPGGNEEDGRGGSGEEGGEIRREDEPVSGGEFIKEAS